MTQETRRAANWLLAIGAASAALGLWLWREADLVAPHDPHHGAAMLYLGALAFTVAGATVLLMGIILRVVERRRRQSSGPTPN